MGHSGDLTLWRTRLNRIRKSRAEPNEWILLAVLFVAPVTAQAQEKPQLEIAGFSLSKKDPNSEFGQGLSRMRSPGLEVDVYFQLPGETVLSLDNKASNIVLKTNEGTELPLAEMFDGNFNMSPGENASVGIVSMKSGELPGKKTTQLKIDGTFVFNVGRDLKSADAELKLTEGSKVKFGPLEATVGQIGETFGEPFKQSVELSCKDSFDSIATVEFLDSKGTAIESSEGGSGSFGFGGDVTYSRSWQIASDAKAVKVRVSYYAKTESVKVPCSLEFGLGL